MDEKKNLTYSSLSKTRGFALITLILIIAVVGTVISYHIIALQQRAHEQKVQKTAMVIQGVMQAASAYYSDYLAWPQAGQSEPWFISEQFSKYLPFGTILLTNTAFHYYQTTDTAPLFKLDIWGNLSLEDAKEIAALLPNSEVIPEEKGITNIIRITLNREYTILSKSNSPIIIAQINNVSLSKNDFYYDENVKRWKSLRRTVQFSCPAGYTGDLMVYPYAFKIANKSYNVPGATIKEIGLWNDLTQKDDNLSCSQENTTGTWQCRYTYIFEGEVCGSGEFPEGDNKFIYCPEKRFTPFASTRYAVPLTGYSLSRDNGYITLQQVAYCRKHH